MIGIIILNYNNWNETQACIESVLQNQPQQKYRIFCVDNGSTIKPDNHTSELLRHPDITTFYNPTNIGYAAGNNIGIKAAKEAGCDAILISNNDIRFFDGTITGMYEYLKSHPSVGIVGPRIVDRDGNTQKANMCLKTGMKENLLLRTRFHVFFPGYNRRYWGLNYDYDRETFPVHAVSGCCFMMSGACAEDVTPLDEGTFLYEEEFILGIHMEQTGWKTMYVPQFSVQHLHGASTKHVKVFAYTCNVNSEIYYCRKYLKASGISLWALYFYRIIIYLLHCLHVVEYRAGLKKFIKETWLYMMDRKL
ncbi:glycosyltransferase [Clostridium sp. MCC353]|uniref:glycosyltransferase family 2 protein n=1 Tax=Clostridium sp. MCC353 TaxID=2592646 RepID=UPI001C022D1A|nr:glycosyltransferase family 2 protein [Clostridium sp. MCC353]MBT9777207.1 glycosyltransferase [Clostridium sp. MCC353]